MCKYFDCLKLWTSALVHNFYIYREFIVRGMPIFVDSEDRINPQNSEFNEYLSLYMWSFDYIMRSMNLRNTQFFFEPRNLILTTSNEFMVLCCFNFVGSVSFCYCPWHSFNGMTFRLGWTVNICLMQYNLSYLVFPLLKTYHTYGYGHANVLICMSFSALWRLELYHGDQFIFQ